MASCMNQINPCTHRVYQVLSEGLEGESNGDLITETQIKKHLTGIYSQVFN